jgi:hypothetical protein
VSYPHPAVPAPVGPPPNTGRRSRLPWVLAALAVVVALAAVAALAVVLVSGDDEDSSAGAGTERSFASPEEAVGHLVDRLAAGEVGAASEAFAVESLVDGYSFEAYTERLQAATYESWLPGGSQGFDDLNAELRRGAVADELRSLVRSILAPDRDYLTTTPLDDDLTAADVAGELSPEPLSELSVVRVDELDNTDPGYLESLEAQAAVYGADELRMVAVLLDTAEGQVAAGATVVRYDDEWALMSLSAPLLNIPTAQVSPTSEEGYLDALESARTVGD